MFQVFHTADPRMDKGFAWNAWQRSSSVPPVPIYPNSKGSMNPRMRPLLVRLFS